MSAAGRSFVRTLALAAVVVAAFGCSPEYDWREVRPTDQGYVVMLPGKPSRLSRPVTLDGMTVPMTMNGARAAESSFAVGTAELPDASPETRARAEAAMRAAMVRNIAGSETAASALAVPIVDATGTRVGAAGGMRVEARGTIEGKPASLVATFVADGARAWQVVAVGQGLDREQAATFVDSFRLLR